MLSTANTRPHTVIGALGCGRAGASMTPPSRLLAHAHARGAAWGTAPCPLQQLPARARLPIARAVQPPESSSAASSSASSNGAAPTATVRAASPTAPLAQTPAIGPSGFFVTTGSMDGDAMLNAELERLERELAGPYVFSEKQVCHPLCQSSRHRVHPRLQSTSPLFLTQAFTVQHHKVQSTKATPAHVPSPPPSIPLLSPPTCATG